MTFGEKLSSLRKQANLTQSELATKLNISRQAITKWEKGNGLPDIDNIKNISTFFNVSIDELLDYKIESIELELNTTTEKISKEDSKFKNVDNFILNKFKNANNIYRLGREKKLTFWQNVLDFFIGAGTLEVADLLGKGIVYSYLVEENNNQYLVLVNKENLITKKLEEKFETKMIIDGYKYTKYEKQKIK